MSTRAVYKFYNRATNDSVIFWRQHDGYPNGWFGALERIRSVVALAHFDNLALIYDLMKVLEASEVKDEMVADKLDQQHRYTVDLDDGQVTLTHYDWQIGTKHHYLLTADGWKQRWMADAE
jgi:hypothetical protein|tara:strand:+ start:195 stop:557 length:363 start_codon:yes stop_codon:yes gene_type:complete